MFTGIIEELGEVRGITRGPDSARLTVAADLASEVVHGASVAVNGVCLTVTDDGAADPGRAELTFDVMAQTLDLTALGALEVGHRVNLERPMVLGGRLDGHLVQGHVDATATITSRTPGEAWEVMELTLPGDLAPFVVAQGSITVDGISLTVASLAPEHFTVSLIPTTLALTTLGHKGVGDPVNLEVDVIAKYVERMLTTRRSA